MVVEFDVGHTAYGSSRVTSASVTRAPALHGARAPAAANIDCLPDRRCRHRLRRSTAVPIAPGRAEGGLIPIPFS